MKTSTVFKILGAICLLLILWQLFIHLIGVFFLACLIIGFFAIIFFVMKFATSIFARNKTEAAQQAPQAVHRIWEAEGTTALFSREPAIADLISGTSPTVKALEDKGDVIRLDNNTKIAVVQDNQAHAVQVKVVDGPSKGKTGWVSRSAIVKD